MKKSIKYIIVVGVLALICACQSPQEKENPYDALIGQLEAKTYESALAEFVKLVPEYSNIQMMYKNAKRQVIGEWITLGKNKRDSIFLKEDGTCMIGKQNLTWEIRLPKVEDVTKELDGNLISVIEVDVKLQNEPIFRLVFEWEPKYEIYSMHLGVYYERGVCEFDENSETYYYQSDDVTEVTISEENVWNYFEYRAFTNWYGNEQVGYPYFLCLKPEYVENILIRETQIGLEFEAQGPYRSIVVDFANKKLTIGDAHSYYQINAKSSGTVLWNGTFKTDEDYEGYYPALYIGNSLMLYKKAENSFVVTYDDILVHKIDGQIVWVNK